MILWIIIILIAIALQIIMDFIMWFNPGSFINIQIRTYFDLAFLLIVLGMLYRIFTMQKKGEKEKLKLRIKELEEKIKELEGK